MANEIYNTGLAGPQRTQLVGTTVESFTQTAHERVAPLGYGVDGAQQQHRYSLGVNAAITGIAPVQAVQTTAAQWGLTNPSTNTKWMFFDMLGVWLVSGTAGTTGNVVAYTIFTTPAQTSMTTGLAIQNDSGGSGTSALLAKSAVTITAPAAPVWVPLADIPSSASAAILSVSLRHDDLQGRICLPPGFSVGLNVYGAAGSTPLFAPCARWTEYACTAGL